MVYNKAEISPARFPDPQNALSLTSCFSWRVWSSSWLVWVHGALHSSTQGWQGQHSRGTGRVQQEGRDRQDGRKICTGRHSGM